MSLVARRFIRWYAGLPIGLVGAHSIFLGLLLSAAEWDGWVSWGHEASIIMVLPIALWIAATICARG
jgi:hypothetical protein